MSAVDTLSQLRQDIQEYERLLRMATRLRVQDSLRKEVDKLRREALVLEKKTLVQLPGSTESSSPPPVMADKGDHSQKYVQNISNYGFDQTQKYMELYLPFDNLSEINEDKITASFTSRSVTVRVQFPDKTCQLHIARLCENIVPTESYCKKKSKHVLVMLKKEQVGKTWPTVTEREKKAKEKKDKPKFDEKEDPGASLTRLLQNMYEEGDDEMKRSISKAWYESQTKKREMEPFPDL